MQPPYQQDIPDLLREFRTDVERGLDAAESSRRLEEHGPNELIDHGAKSPWMMLWEQMTGWLVILLIVSSAVSIYLGDYNDAIAIMIIVVINAVLGVNQEYRTEKAMAALKRMAVPFVKVRRDGEVMEISARELVAGDIVLLETGNVVPADCRLVDCANLRIQESALTGESEPIEKFSKALTAEGLAVGDRRNMAYMGTVVTYGRGTGMVVATGMQTELGAIATMLQHVGSDQTPLQNKLDQLGKGLVIAAVALVAIIFTLGLARGENWHKMFLTAVSMAVAAVPEGLPAVVTIALAIGAQKMLKRHALIRKLPAVESLGAVTVICSDKTGTLTQNRMTVTKLDIPGKSIDLAALPNAPEPLVDNSAVMLLAGGALCNDASVHSENNGGEPFVAVGDPTEGALLVGAARCGLDKRELDHAFPRVAEAPFDSDRKRMSTVHEISPLTGEFSDLAKMIHGMLRGIGPFRYVAFTKGSVDGILECSSHIVDGGIVHTLDAQYRKRIIDANTAQARAGYRVLGVAMRLFDENPGAAHPEDIEHGLTFIGLIGMIDPARPEAKLAVATCSSAGIRPVMITGDHPLTARHIADELGIGGGGVVTGRELDSMSPAEFETAATTAQVFARVSPEHKLLIVRSLRDNGEIVAMTGDGVNDAPALKQADIGVAMGITGADVSKEAADMILLDDNFATIVAAVEEGRVIYDNVRKFLKYMLTSNSGELWLMLVAPFLGMPLPLLPIQILWINLVTDGLPALALGVEPGERFIMRRPPYKPNENIFSRGLGRHVILVGMLMGLVPLLTGYIMWKAHDPHWQTMLFTIITLAQMGHAMAVRSERDSLFTIGFLSNKFLLGAVMLTFVMQLFIIYVPAMYEFFHTIFLTPGELLVALLLSSVVFWVVELEKWFGRRHGEL